MLKLLCLIALVAAAAGGAAPAKRQRYSAMDNNSLGEYLRALLNNLKEVMPRGIPELNIPPLDPLQVPEVRAHIQEGPADVNLHLENLRVNGLSGFTIRDVKGDLNTMTFSLDLFLPEITGTGRYDLDGKIIIFPLYGKGAMGLQVNDLQFQGTATISIVDMKKIQLSNFDMHVMFSQIQMYLENIVGGGNLGNMVNTLINMMGKMLYDRFKDQILPAVNRIIRDALNQQLEKIDIGSIIGGARPPATAFSGSVVQDSVNTYVDRLMQNMRPFLRQNNLDPMQLPHVTSGFNRRVLGVRWHGGIAINNGDVNSLSSIHRVGDFKLQHEGHKLTIGGTVGVSRLWGSMGATAWFMRMRVNPGLRFSTNSVQVRARITADLSEEGELVQLEEFGISHVARIRVSILNMGPLGWLLNPLANLGVNLAKGRIIAAIEEPVRKEIIEMLDKVEMPQF